VGTLKLTLMCVGTLGLYQIYWFYQNWRRLRDQEGIQVQPVLRAIFSVFFVYSLFRNVHEKAEDTRVDVGWSAGLLATVYILLSLAVRFPDPIWLVTFLSFVPMLPVQNTIARLNASRGLPPDPWSKLSLLNWFGIAVGGLTMAFVILGVFLVVE
jgi:hypothetical protein